jgi:hypothetical protein
MMPNATFALVRALPWVKSLETKTTQE